LIPESDLQILDKLKDKNLRFGFQMDGFQNVVPAEEKYGMMKNFS